VSTFADLADGGRRLAAAVGDAVAHWDEPCLVAIMPNGVPVAQALASDPTIPAMGPILGIGLVREGEPTVVEVPDVLGRPCIVVDDGVETGTAARLVGSALRQAGAPRLLLAVPVCPREAEPGLARIYDSIVAVDRPLVRRDLRWHYDHFDTIDEAEARRRLDAR
jgi:predicted phosphoribosyltransferase